MSGTVDFYYDFISPNAYLAWQPIRDIAKEHDRELVLKPVLFAGLLQAFDQVGPAEVRPKMQWMVRNCLRKAKNLAVDLAPPHSHPFNPLLSLRIALAAKPDEAVAVSDALFRAVWAQSQDVSDSTVVSAALADAGLDAGRLMEAAQGTTIKQRLREETEAAVTRGVFGVPTCIVDDELFFGFDDLPWLARFLRGEDPDVARDYAAWTRVRPSAWRKKQ